MTTHTINNIFLVYRFVRKFILIFYLYSRSKIKLPEGVTSTKVSPGTNNLVSPKIRKQKISESEQQIQICQWMGCFETFDDDEALLRHVVTHASVKADALTEELGQKATARYYHAWAVVFKLFLGYMMPLPLLS
jgi:hypothetical protein